MSTKGLVIGAEVLSKTLDWSDRTTAVLFGDGAGGVLLEETDEEHFFGESLNTMVARVVLSQEPLQLSRLIQMSLISLIPICKWMGKRSLILPLRQFQRALRPWLKKR